MRSFNANKEYSGLYGIQAARTYLDIHPQSSLVVLESDHVVGGTWSSSKELNF